MTPDTITQRRWHGVSKGDPAETPAERRRRLRRAERLSSDDNIRWFALRVVSQTELWVAKHLRWQGATAVVPVHRSWRRLHRYAKAKRPRERVLIPGYVWIALASPEPWADVLCWDYVKSVVSFGGDPLAMRTSQVKKILNDEENDVFADNDLWKNMRSYGEYNLGDNVEFDHGPFSGYKGKVVDLNSKDARVLIEFFGTEREIKVPVDACVKAA
ncbi:MAG: transcription termination/antitermination NusG family protein [Pseudomonadota bacterium]